MYVYIISRLERQSHKEKKSDFLNLALSVPDMFYSECRKKVLLNKFWSCFFNLWNMNNNTCT